jgi:hypothetical protein
VPSASTIEVGQGTSQAQGSPLSRLWAPDQGARRVEQWVRRPPPLLGQAPGRDARHACTRVPRRAARPGDGPGPRPAPCSHHLSRPLFPGRAELREGRADCADCAEADAGLDLGDLVVVLLAGTLAGLRDRLLHDGFEAAASLVADLVEITDDYVATIPP